MLLQMCGRAGRPQFDTEGSAVIMTQKHTRGLYEGLVHGRASHSSTSRLNLSHFLSMKPPNVSHKKCSRQAEKWRSVSPLVHGTDPIESNLGRGVAGACSSRHPPRLNPSFHEVRAACDVSSIMHTCV